MKNTILNYRICEAVFWIGIANVHRKTGDPIRVRRSWRSTQSRPLRAWTKSKEKQNTKFIARRKAKTKPATPNKFTIQKTLQHCVNCFESADFIFFSKEEM